MPFDRQATLASPTGAAINLYRRKAEGSARAVVQINHGLAEHAARYERFADFLGQRGFHVYAHDHRGHGYTKAPDAPPGKFGQPDGAARALADIGAVHDLIAQEHPGLPVILFGHSLGGVLALNFMLQNSARLHGAAIWNANVSAGLSGRAAQAILAWEKFRLGSDVPSRLLPKLTFEAWGKAVPGHRTLFDWLSRDPAEVEKYIADPLCGWGASVSLWQDIFGLIFQGADDRNFVRARRDLPVLLVGGGKDPATDGGKAVRHLHDRMRRMGFSRLALKIDPEARHECLNDLDRDAVMADFVSWVEGVIEHKRIGTAQVS